STSPSCPILVRSLPTSPLFPYTTLFRSAAGTGLPTGLGRPPTDGDRRPGGAAGRGAVHQRGPTQPQRRSGRPCHGAGALPARPCPGAGRGHRPPRRTAQLPLPATHRPGPRGRTGDAPGSDRSFALGHRVPARAHQCLVRHRPRQDTLRTAGPVRPLTASFGALPLPAPSHHPVRKTGALFSPATTRLCRKGTPILPQEPSMASTESPLTPSEVAALFRVDTRTVTRWAKEGKISSFRTPGGHRRSSSKEIYALRAANFTTPQR